MAMGTGVYFALPFEPIFAYPWIIAALSALIIIWRKPNVIITTILLFIFGFFYAGAFTRLINTPQIKHNLRNAEIIGTVSNIDYTNNKPRIFIKTQNLVANRTTLIRVSIDSDLSMPNVGDTIHSRVTLFRPGGPDAPGAFDYSRWAYFNGLTATGYLNSHIDAPAHSGTNSISALRDYIHSKTNSFLSDTLVLGYKNAVPENDVQIWTATGVNHVWSISGFHMTLVGGWLLLLFYLVFRSIPPITRNIPARFPAIVCAWFGLLFYLFLSGVDIATVRAFLMTSLMFIAFLFGRNAFSMRNVCLAFILIYLMNPHYVLQPGFQLSFAAIFGLIWYFDGKSFKHKSVLRRAWNITRYAAMTSIIATIFTSVFVAHHFYSIPIYGLIGNLILLPVFSLAIMPLVIFGTVTALFGWLAPLTWSDAIYNWTLIVANKISTLPYATVQIPHISGSALSVFVLGFLCLMFVRNTDKFRHASIILFCIFISFGITIVATAPRPLFYTTSDNELVGFVNDGKLSFNKSRASNHYFAFDSWRQLNFEKPSETNQRFKCTRGVCEFQTPNWDLIYIQKFVPLMKSINKLCKHETPTRTRFIVSYFKIDAPKCNATILNGGFVIYENGKIKYTQTGRWWNTLH